MLPVRATTTSIAAVIAACLLSTSADAHKPLPWQRGPHLGPYRAAFTAPAGTKSGTWQALANPFTANGFPDTAVLLTDGTVLMHSGCTPRWYKLTPDSHGSYVNGTWTATATMPSAYRPLYFASQVLADGRLIVNGGEYLKCESTWTTLGALYDPVADKWTAVAPPTGWTTIGDAQSVVRPDKTYMLANCCGATFGAGPEAALASISGTTVTWTPTGTGKADDYDEEGWTLLPDQTIVTVDANRDLGGSFNDSEIYSAGCGCWTGGKPTKNSVVDAGSHELGPAPLLPNGLVFQIGATGHNDVYSPLTGKWTAAPDFPMVDGLLDSADGPAAVLPNGRILAQVSPGVFNPPSHFFEIAVNGPSKVTMTQVSEPASAPGQTSYEGRMLVLPTGQVFWTSDVGDIEIYTPAGLPQAAWMPTITKAPGFVVRGSTGNVVHGTLFNGLSFGGYYGDDAQMATNYPIVRITNIASGSVCYARTHDHATMGISDGGPTSTKFDVPTTCDPGKSTLVVVANGIASAPVAVKVN